MSEPLRFSLRGACRDYLRSRGQPIEDAEVKRLQRFVETCIERARPARAGEGRLGMYLSQAYPLDYPSGKEGPVEVAIRLLDKRQEPRRKQ